MVPAIDSTATTVRCLTPAGYGIVGLAPLSIIVDGTINFTPPINFTFYGTFSSLPLLSSLLTFPPLPLSPLPDCVFASPGVRVGCQDCLSNQYAACTWCGTACNSAVNCTAGQNVSYCPGTPPPPPHTPQSPSLLPL